MISTIGSNPYSSFKHNTTFLSSSNNSSNNAEARSKKSFLNIPAKDWLTYSALGTASGTLAGSLNYKYAKESGMKNLKAHTGKFAILGFLLPVILLPLSRVIGEKLENHS